MIDDSGSEIQFSSGSIWELAIKIGLGKLTLSLPFLTWMNQAGTRGECSTIIESLPSSKRLLLSRGPHLRESRAHAAYVFGVSIALTSCHALTALSCDAPLLSAI